MNQYTVTFDANGGSGGTSKKMDYGTTITAPTVTRTGYTFKSWSPAVAATVPANNVTYKASWTANGYSIVYDGNGGSGTTDSTACVYDAEGIVADSTFIRPGYEFVGWATEEDGMCVYSAGEAVTNLTASPNGVVTLYAIWRLLPPVFSPASGTTFDGASLAISLSSEAEGVSIYYTTDGSEPTVGSTVYRRFRISGKTTVKAVAEKDGMLSDVAIAEYALGQCLAPVISLADGTEFSHSGRRVSIRWNHDGVLRCTLDGSDPTPESPEYEGSFAISESTVVKAKVFSDDLFDSAVVTANLVRVWENVATPVVDAVESFTGSKTKVVISCATEGALVRYTLNGNEPNSHSTKYAGPFYVTDSCTVKAYAVKADYLDSAVATRGITKVWGIGDSLGKPDHEFTTEGDGEKGWLRVEDATAPNGEAMKSGAVTHNQSSTLATTVMGPGTLTFSWRTSCEDSGGEYDWDHAEFAVDGEVQLRRDGENGWHEESVRIEGDGAHAVTWTYKKDDIEAAGEDAAWVAGYGWASDYTETRTTEVPVPYAWLLRYDPEIVDEYDAYEEAAKLTGANGHRVWESYVIDVDPNDRADTLRITAFTLKPDGTPDLENIAFEPPQERWNVPNARPVLKGRAMVGDGDWQPVTDENKALFRFFMLSVELP